MKANHLKIMLCDDHPVVLEGLSKALAIAENFEIVGQASSLAEARRSLRQNIPDILVLDLALGDGSGIDFLREARARHPKMRVLILTLYCETDTVQHAYAAHADGYVLKEEPLTSIVDAIRRVARGERVWNGRVAEALADAMSGEKSETSRLGELSYQEQRIVERVARGLTNCEIAREIKLSDKTVRNYLSGVMQKLSVRRRAEVASIYTRNASRLTGRQPG